MKDKANAILKNILRQKAEEFLNKKSIETDKHYTDVEIYKLVDELNTHQIELEKQNEELNSAKIKAEINAKKYTDLYDFAPSGYFTLSKKGEIIELNFRGATLLGKERSLLQKKRFALYIAAESKPRFNSFLEELFKSKIRQTCEIVLSNNTKIPTYVNLSGIVSDDDQLCVITMEDISQHKIAEDTLKKSQLLLQSTLESQVDTIIFSIDKEYKYLSFNKAHSDIMKYAYNADIKVGMNILDCISSIEDRKIAKENFDRSLAGETHSNIRVFGEVEKAHFESFFNPIVDVNHKIIGATGLARNIKKRLQNQENLRISEEKYRTLFEKNRDSITLFRLDQEGKPGNFIEANQATKSIFGYTKKDLLEMNIGDLEIVSDKKRASLIAILLSEGSVDFETIIKNKKGDHRYVEIESIVVNYLSKPAVMNITRDITERKQNEENTRKAQENLATILEAIPDLLFEVDLEGRIYYYQGNRNDLLAVPESEFMEKKIQEILPVEAANICLEAIQEALDKGWSSGKQYSLDLAQGKYWFEISVSPIHESNLQTKHFIMLARDITARIEAQEALQKSQEKLFGLFNVANSGIVMIDKSGKFLLFNDWCCKLLGYTRTEFQELNTTIISHPDDLKRSSAFNKKIIEGKIDTYQIEKRYIRKDKSFVWCEVSASAIKDQDNNLINIIGVINDITERRKAKIALQKSEARLIETQALAKLGSWETDFTFKNAIWSRETARIYGIDEKATQFTLEEFLSIVHPEDRLLVQTEFVHSIKKHSLNRFEHRIITPAGIEKFVEQRWKIVRDDKGQPLLAVGSCLDITERKLAEEKLIESESLLNQTQIIANIGSYSFDFTDQKWTSSTALDNIFGIDPNFEKSIENWILIVHPDWREIMNDYFNDVITRKTKFNAEYKFIKIDSKEERWAHGIGEISFDNEGNPKRLIGSIQDITDRKLVEEKLMASEKFLNQTQAIANLGSYSLDFSTGKWTSSTVLNNIFGIDTNFEKTIEGWISIIHPDWKKIMNDYLNNEVIGKKANFNTEYKIIKIDNKEERWVHGMGEIIFNNEKQPMQLIGSIQDITEQKLAEATLRESEEKYRGLVENSPDGVVIYVENKIAYINDEGTRMLGAKNKEEIIGQPVLRYVHPDSLENIVQKMIEVNQENHASETIEEKFETIQGVPFDVEIKAIPTFYEHKPAVQIIAHDITKRKQTALELNKINRVYALISQINNLILRTHNQKELFQEICNIAVNFGKFRMSWIGLLNEDNHKIITAAFAGHEKGYFTKSNITSILDIPEGRGPTGIAMREGRTVICNDIANDSMMKPWRKDALERGYSSVISIPIIVRNKKIGAFNLYSEETNFFSSEEEISLLEKIVLNIAFALDAIQIEEDRKRTEEKIRQLSQAVEQSPVTIVITNTNGEIEYANPKFIETTGYTIEEVVGKNPRFLKSGHTSSNEYNELWQTLSVGKEWHGEFHNKRKDGSFFWESATISPIINAQGESTHFIAIKEDITERKIAEQELINAKLRAEESDRLKLVFLANMSHEIRTPMNGILGFTELLKEPHLTGRKQKEYISIIEKSGKRMLNIINDIISISKIESGLIEVSLSETNIKEEMKYIHNFFQLETKQKGIQLHISKELPAKYSIIKTDREKLYAILSNLVKNAIKFTNQGTIEFGCEKKGENIEFFVKDSGIGISNSQKNVVFERFRQANESLTRSHEGSGLGLAISKAYVEMLGGKIRVESEEGKGSTFYFTIPYNFEPELQEKIVIEKTNGDVKEENKINSLKVLIVEDDAISKLLITIAVKPYSKEILKVSNGLQAIEACRNSPDIDLVMMDINMPEMGGYEATKQIREFNKDLVIIAQTANGMQSDRDEAINSGCTDYISKPINIIDLSKLIHKYFNK